MIEGNGEDDDGPVHNNTMMIQQTESAPPIESSPVFDLPPLTSKSLAPSPHYNNDDAYGDHDDSHYSSSSGYDDDESTTSLGDEYVYNNNNNNVNNAFPEFPSWISELEDINPFANMEPTLFPYHIPTGFSVQPPSSRRLSGSTIATASPFDVVKDNNINGTTTNTRKGMNLNDALDVLKIRLLLQKTHTSHLERVRPATVRVVWTPKNHTETNGSGATTKKIRPEDMMMINLPDDDPKVLAIKQVEAEIEKINTLRDRLLPLHKKLFWLAMDTKATRTAHAALRRSIRLRNLLKLRTAHRHQMEDKEEDAYLYNLLGKTQLDLGQPGWAISNFQQALDILYSMSNHKGSSSFYGAVFCFRTNNGPDLIDFANTLSLMGEAQLLATKDIELALSSFDKALTIYKREKAYALVAETTRTIGKIHRFHNNNNNDEDGGLEAAIEIHQETLDFQREHLGDNHELVADSWMALGDCYYCQLLTTKLLSSKQQQQQLSPGTNDNKQEQQQQQQQQEQQQLHQRTLECYQEALAIFRNVMGDDHELVTDALVALGDLFCMQPGQEDRALFYYGEVVQQQEQQNSDAAAPAASSSSSSTPLYMEYVVLKIAILLFQQGQTSLALNKFQQVIRICREQKGYSDDSEPYFNALISSAVCYYVEGNKEAARKSFKDAIAMSCQSSMFVNKPVVEKMLKVSLSRVDTTRIGKAIGGIVKRSVLMQQDNKKRAPYAESDLETINESISEAMWFYYMDSDSVGKFADGWIPFEIHTGLQMEDMYQNWISNNSSNNNNNNNKKPTPASLQRTTSTTKTIILSESSGFSYEINFQRMTQTNTVTKRIRPIERTQDGRAPTTEPDLEYLPKYDVDAPKYYDQETISPVLDARETAPGPSVADGSGGFSAAFPLRCIKL